MATGQTALAIGIVFALLAAVILKWGKPAGSRAWAGRLARKPLARRIGLVESRMLPNGCALHLVKVDEQEFLLAQTGGSCTTVGSWETCSNKGDR